jgi:O-antigen/teichoic acid export membrane protein
MGLTQRASDGSIPQKKDMSGLVLRAEEAFGPERSTDDLATRSVRGGAISTVGQAAQFIFQVGGTVLLARLLTPRDFGLVAMVTVITTFGMLLRDAGLSTATVQSRTLTREQASVLFWVNSAAGILLGLGLVAAAPAVAAFYGEHELVLISMGLAVPLLLSGLSAQHSALLRRSMRFTAMTVVQIASYGSYFVVAVVAAWLGLGYWSLILANGAGIVMAMLQNFFFCRWLPSRPRRGVGAAGLFRFGGHVLGSNLVNYFTSNADSILVGRFLGAGPLGLYNRAYNFVALPVSQLRDLAERVGLPVLRLLIDEAERYRRYYLRMANIVATVCFPVGMICVVEGGFFVRVLLGEQWLGATPVFRILGAVMIIRPAMATVEIAQLSTGQSRRFFYWSMFTSAVYVASFVAGLAWGISGVAGAFAIANYALALPGSFYCLRLTPVRVRDFWRQLLVPLIVTGCLAGVVLAMHAIAGHALLWQGLGVVVFVVAYVVASAARPSVRELVGPLLHVRRPLQKPSPQEVNE